MGVNRFNQRQMLMGSRTGLRRFGVGAITMLLGTSVYLGFNPTIASAAANVLHGADDQKLTTDSTSNRLAGSSYALSANSAAAQPASSVAAVAASSSSASANSAASNVDSTAANQASSAETGQAAGHVPAAKLGSVNFYQIGNSTSTKEPTLAPIKYSRDSTTGQLGRVELTTSNPEINEYVQQLDSKSQSPVNLAFFDSQHHELTAVDPQRLADSSRDIPVYYQLMASSSQSAANQTAKVTGQDNGSPTAPRSLTNVPTNVDSDGDDGPAIDINLPAVRHLTYSVIDGTTGQVIVRPTVLFSGRAGDEIPQIVQNNYELIRQGCASNGYVFDRSKAEGRGYDLLPTALSDDQKDNNVTIYLVHDHETTTRRSEVSRMVNYVFANGGEAAISDVDSPLVFKNTKVVDKVTKKVVSDRWTPKSQDFADLTVPKIDGYRPNIPAVNDHNIQHNQGPIVKTVIYTPVDPDKPVTGNLTYSVVDDVTGDTLVDNAPLASGGSGSPIPATASQIYEYVRQSWIAQGYRLDTKKANGQGYDTLPERFANDADEDQNVTVYLTHNQHESFNHTSVSRQILYYFTNGLVASPVVESKPLQFTEKRVRDAVTDELVSDEWIPQSAEFPEVVSPTIDGYQPDKKVVKNVGVTHDQGPITEIVTYIPNQQELTYSVINDTTGQVLVDKALLATGGTGTAVSATAKANYTKVRSYWQSHGYQLDTSKEDQRGYSTLPAKFGVDGDQQNVTIYLLENPDSNSTRNANTDSIVSPATNAQQNQSEFPTDRVAQVEASENRQPTITLVETPNNPRKNEQPSHSATSQDSLTVTQSEGLLGLANY